VGAEFEIDNWIWVDHKPAILSIIESQHEGSTPSLTAFEMQDNLECVHIEQAMLTTIMSTPCIGKP
jgi:hypothetical protein